MQRGKVVRGVVRDAARGLAYRLARLRLLTRWQGTRSSHMSDYHSNHTLIRLQGPLSVVGRQPNLENFRRLVLGCMDADFLKSILVRIRI